MLHRTKKYSVFPSGFNISSSVKRITYTHKYTHVCGDGDYAYRFLICTGIDGRGKNSIRTFARNSSPFRGSETRENVIVHPQIPIETGSSGLLRDKNLPGPVCKTPPNRGHDRALRPAERDKFLSERKGYKWRGENTRLNPSNKFNGNS